MGDPIFSGTERAAHAVEATKPPRLTPAQNLWVPLFFWGTGSPKFFGPPQDFKVVEPGEYPFPQIQSFLAPGNSPAAKTKFFRGGFLKGIFFLEGGGVTGSFKGFPPHPPNVFTFQATFSTISETEFPPTATMILFPIQMPLLVYIWISNYVCASAVDLPIELLST